MLTRLKVSGFKNLVDVEVHFGPFTCIAGANGVGKSNILDAISFLSALSSRSLLEAALSVRDENARSGDVKSLFHRVGANHLSQISFQVDLIIPRTGSDDLGQHAVASSTYLQYDLKLGYKQHTESSGFSNLEILEEKLDHIRFKESKKKLGFDFSGDWAKSVLHGRRGTPYISTLKEGEGPTYIRFHQEGTGGTTRRLVASNLPRTALSAATAAETPTATLARREMQSWSLLHLEPSSLRAPDPFNSSTLLGSDGSHLAATLYRMAHSGIPHSSTSSESVYSRVANRLMELIDDVRQIEVERDDRRELYTIYVTGKDGTRHPARSLSDGTLRFLALAVLEEDRQSTGILCFEEPENGIHPKRISAILRLLEDIAVDTNLAVDVDNPLRQILINTHSPSVVAQVPDSSLLFAEGRQIIKQKQTYTVLGLSYLPGTWRAGRDGMTEISKGQILEYLDAIPSNETSTTIGVQKSPKRRVVDRTDLQPSLDFLGVQPALHATR